MLGILLVLSLAALACAQTSVGGTIRNLGDPVNIFTQSMNSAEVFLNYGEYKTYVHKNGNFEFHNIPNGLYLLTVNTQRYQYPTYQVKLDDGRYTAYTLNMTSKMKHVAETPLNVIPVGEQEYFDIRQPMDVGAIIKSPFGMIIGFTLLMLFCVNNMPNMDEMQQAEEPTGGQAPAQTTRPAPQRASR